MKTCSKCKLEKGLDEFQNGKNYRYGVKGICRSCVSEYNSTRYTKKPPEYFEEKRRIANEIKIEQKRLKAEARVALNELMKPILDANKKEARREYGRIYRAKNKVKRKIDKKNRKKRVSGRGRLSSTITSRLMISQNGKCISCHCKLVDFHIDHIIPIALGGTNTDDNVQLLCPTCNISKGAKHPISFMQERGFLL